MSERPAGPAAVDVVVLAGGTGRRLGGARKPDVVARGARLLDHVLAGLAGLAPSASTTGGAEGPPGRVVVVAPEEVALPPGVLRALEDPPLGGPVAGLAAGLARLARAPGPSALTGVVTCDAPESWRALPALIAEVRQGGDARDGACVREADRVQYLLGVYRTVALSECVAPGGAGLRNAPVRRVLGRLAVAHIDLGALGRAAHDLDTWEEVRAWDADG